MLLCLSKKILEIVRPYAIFYSSLSCNLDTIYHHNSSLSISIIVALQYLSEFSEIGAKHQRSMCPLVGKYRILPEKTQEEDRGFDLKSSIDNSCGEEQDQLLFGCSGETHFRKVRRKVVDPFRTNIEKGKRVGFPLAQFSLLTDFTTVHAVPNNGEHGGRSWNFLQATP